MNTIKTVLTTTSIITCFAISSVQANGFFQVDSTQKYEKQPNTFNETAHEGTTFWSYFNNGLSKQTPQIKKVASFDHSKHEGTAFWGEFHN